MVFSSIVFIFFFLSTSLLLYFLMPKKCQNGVLTSVSLVFFAWGGPKYLLVLLASVLIEFFSGLLMNRYSERTRLRKAIFIASVTLNLALLVVFKYRGFLGQTLFEVFGIENPFPNFVLPLGISFYTFQGLSYVIDLYWKKMPVQKNFGDYLCYITMFPQIVAGPIVRYDEIQRQLTSRSTSLVKIGEGAGIFIKGLCKKVLLANNIGMLWDSVEVSELSSLPLLTSWLGIIAFAMKIYFDFSGYSDMAVGMGKMLGFSFPQNFNHPYISASITEFWSRWHMTVSGWFRSYLYIPLGGNRKGRGRTILNLLIVWTLTGLWHGADWNFVLWGFYFFVLLVCEKFLINRFIERIPRIFRVILTFTLVLISWVIFELPALSDVISYIASMFGGGGSIYDSLTLYYLRNFSIPLIICFLCCGNLPSKLISKLESSSLQIQKIYYASVPFVQLIFFCCCTAFLVNDTYNPFLYLRF